MNIRILLNELERLIKPEYALAYDYDYLKMEVKIYIVDNPREFGTHVLLFSIFGDWRDRVPDITEMLDAVPKCIVDKYFIPAPIEEERMP